MARPIAINEKDILALEDAFRNACNIKQACILAKVKVSTYYDRLNNDPEFSERMEQAQLFPTQLAKKVLVDALKAGDRTAAGWWLERKEKAEFAQRQELSGPEGLPLGYIHSGDLKQLEADQPETLKELPDGTT